MREGATELVDSAKSFALAKQPTLNQVQRLAQAFAENLASVLGGTVRIELPGNIIITRADPKTTAAMRR